MIMKRVPLNTTVNETLLNEWKEVAEEEGRDLNWYIETLVGHFLQMRKKNRPAGPAGVGAWPFMAPPRR
jgi:hypothetical protein